MNSLKYQEQPLGRGVSMTLKQAPIYNPPKMKTLIRKDMGTPMFIAVLFTAAKVWKQPECPSTDEWIKKIWHVSAIEYKKEWNFDTCNNMDRFGGYLISEISQIEIDKYCVIWHVFGT